MSTAGIQQYLNVSCAILCAWCGKEVTAVREGSDPYVDLDDLIFDEEDGGPSER